MAASAGGFNFSFETHKVVYSLQTFLLAIFNQSFFLGCFLSVLLVVTPLYLIYTWGSISKVRAQTNKRTKAAIERRKAKKRSGKEGKR